VAGSPVAACDGVMSRITMRDYNPYWVQRATLLGVAGREVTLACGSVVKVICLTWAYPVMYMSIHGIGWELINWTLFTIWTCLCGWPEGATGLRVCAWQDRGPKCK
jgi:hypothetical protein